MRCRPPITALALAAVLATPGVASANAPAELLAAAAPLQSSARSTTEASASLPAAADLPQSPGELLASAAPLQSGAQLLAEAAPLRDVLVPQDAEPMTDTPIANRDGALLADASDPEQLLAQAPSATATPPAAALPRTGPELLLTLLTGVGLVLLGAGLRLRVPAAAR